MKPLALLVLLLAPAQAWSAQCSPDDVPKLMKDEQARLGNLKECAHSSAYSASMGGLDGVCAANWKRLDEAEAKAAPCMTEEQLDKFERWSGLHDIYCSEILEFQLDPNTPFESQCRTSWDWLKPYEAKKAKEAQAKWARQMSTVDGVLKEERSRQEGLAECAKSSKLVIEMGGLDGVCAADWSFLSPAEAKLAPGMSEPQLKEFSALRAKHEESCRELIKTLGKEAKTVSLCGADWSWLDRTTSSRQLKAGQERALGVFKALP